MSFLSLAAAAPAGEPPLRAAQRSHIEGNVPAADDFDRFLRRDLTAYFAALRKTKDVSVEYELLRAGATQSGVSSPKFYLWVRIGGGKTAQDRGAARVAAIEKTQFEVLSFVPETTIRADPQAINRVFPAPVCDAIKAKLTP